MERDVLPSRKWDLSRLPESKLATLKILVNKGASQAALQNSFNFSHLFRTKTELQRPDNAGHLPRTPYADDGTSDGGMVERPGNGDLTRSAPMPLSDLAQVLHHRLREIRLAAFGHGEGGKRHIPERRGVGR